MIYVRFAYAGKERRLPRCFYTCVVPPPTSQEVPKHSYWVGFQGLYARFYAWLLRRMPSERQRLLAVTILAGGLCGLAAVAFHLSIMGLEALLIDRANTAPGHSWIWWTILSPAIGGLVAGVGLTYFAPAAAGSGIPQVKVAYALRYGSGHRPRNHRQVCPVRPPNRLRRFAGP